MLNPDGTELGRSTSTSRQELVARAITRTGAYKISVRSYAGTGDYIVDVSAGMGTPPPTDRAPTVAMAQPAEGATVSGTVAVSNNAPPPADRHELIRTGRVTAGARDATVMYNVRERGYVDLALNWGGSSDLDFFVDNPSGTERARAYTLANPEQADVPFDTTGTWTVRVNLYAGAGVTDTLCLYVPEAILS